MSARGLVAIAYDTPDDRRRRRLVRALEDVAERVQYSVFEAWLSDAEFAAAWQRWESIANAGEDRLRAYVLCARCAERVFCLRGAPPAPPGNCWLL